jgi:hypothetical protein
LGPERKWLERRARSNHFIVALWVDYRQRRRDMENIVSAGNGVGPAGV